MRLIYQSPEDSISRTRRIKKIRTREVLRDAEDSILETTGLHAAPKGFLSTEQVDDVYRKWLRLVTDPLIREALGPSDDEDRAPHSALNSPQDTPEACGSLEVGVP